MERIKKWLYRILALLLALLFIILLSLSIYITWVIVVFIKMFFI